LGGRGVADQFAEYSPGTHKSRQFADVGVVEDFRQIAPAVILGNHELAGLEHPPVLFDQMQGGQPDHPPFRSPDHQGVAAVPGVVRNDGRRVVHIGDGKGISVDVPVALHNARSVFGFEQPQDETSRQMPVLEKHYGLLVKQRKKRPTRPIYFQDRRGA